MSARCASPSAAPSSRSPCSRLGATASRTGSDVALLELKDVSVRYPIYNAGSMSLRQRLVQVGTGGRIGGGNHQLVTVQALNNVSITLRDGDAAAVVGHNGAGKS